MGLGSDAMPRSESIAREDVQHAVLSFRRAGRDPEASARLLEAEGTPRRGVAIGEARPPDAARQRGDLGAMPDQNSRADTPISSLDPSVR